MTLDPYNAFLHRVEADGDWRVAVKDVIDVAGMPTTAASKVLYRVPDRDAECVARLRAAGATIVGKLNTHEFAFGALTNSPHFGPALNPWDRGAHDRRLERRQRRGRRRRPRRPRARNRHRRVDPDPRGALRGHRPPADGGARPGRRRRPRRVDARRGRPARPHRGGVPARARGHGGAARCGRRGRSAGSAWSPGCSSWPTRRSPRSARRRSRALAGEAEPVELPLHEEISTITQLVMLPEAAAVHLALAADAPRRLRAGRPRPGARRAPAAVDGVRDRPARAELGAGARGSDELGGLDLLVAPAMPIVAPRLDAIPPDYRLLIMPYNSPAALLGLPVTVVPCGLRRRACRSASP